MPHALIIGGSLGGLFAGLLLRQAGWDVTVFERSTGDLAGRGVGIGTHIELFDVMRRLGITIDESMGVAATSRICLGPDGAVIARLPYNKILSSWALFYRALRRHLPDACYRPGMELVDVTQQADGVTAMFANGTKADGDLLVGADGLHSAVRAHAFAAPEPHYSGYVAWRGIIEEQALPAVARELLDSYGFFLPPREMVLSYLQPGADDDHRPGRRRLNWLWYHPVPRTDLPGLCTDATGRHHAAGIPPPQIRPEVIAAFRAEARVILPPQFIALIEATAAPFFQPIFDLDSPRIVAGRVALLADAGFVARPHVGAGVTKAALNAAWLADALATSDSIDAGLAAYEARARPFGSALVARARFLGAHLEDPPRTGVALDPLTVMQSIGAPLRDIPELADYFFDGQGAPQGAQAPAKSSGDTARPVDGLVR
jgi:2-polyprenyl-6-methoxyphenol hydroxylase-like FAD-dependent oxidoreductase